MARLLFFLLFKLVDYSNILSNIQYFIKRR